MLLEEAPDESSGVRLPLDTLKCGVPLVDGFAYDLRQRDALGAQRPHLAQAAVIESDVQKPGAHRCKDIMSLRRSARQQGGSEDPPLRTEHGGSTKQDPPYT